MSKKTKKDQPDKDLNRAWEKLRDQVLSTHSNETLDEGTAVATVMLNIDHRFERQKTIRQKGGEKPKRKEGIWLATMQMLLKSDGNMIARQAWNNFPESHDSIEIENYEVYRDGERVCQTNGMGKSSSICFNTFRQHYFSPAKKNAQ
jgi:hypothetical protein